MSTIKYDFSGENYIVTGASSGMGRQVVLELAAAGARVLAIARSEEKLAELQMDFPYNIVIAAIDVCDANSIGEAIAHFVQSFGKINGLVHAAGIMSLTPLRAYDDTEAHRMMEVSFWAGAKLIQIATKKKYCQDRASIVWFSSERARAAASAMFAYSATKAAIQIAARTFAKELAGRHIRVNTVSPGWVKTNMTNGLESLHNMAEIEASSLLGFGEPEDVSGMILYLLSDRAHWITGTDIAVSGGFSA